MCTLKYFNTFSKKSLTLLLITVRLILLMTWDAWDYHGCHYLKLLGDVTAFKGWWWQVWSFETWHKLQCKKSCNLVLETHLASNYLSSTNFVQTTWLSICQLNFVSWSSLDLLKWFCSVKMCLFYSVHAWN